MRRTPSAQPTPTPAMAPLLSPLEDEDDDEDKDEDDDDGNVSVAEDIDICDVIITVEDVDEVVVVIAGLVDVGMAEAEVALVISIVIGREFEADEE